MNEEVLYERKKRIYLPQVLEDRVLIGKPPKPALIGIGPTRDDTIEGVLNKHFPAAVPDLLRVEPFLYIPGSCLGERWPNPGMKSRVPEKNAITMTVHKSISGPFEVVQLASDLLGQDVTGSDQEETAARLVASDMTMSLGQFCCAYNEILRDPDKDHLFVRGRPIRFMGMIEIDGDAEGSRGIPALMVSDHVRERISSQSKFELSMYGI